MLQGIMGYRVTQLCEYPLGRLKTHQVRPCPVSGASEGVLAGVSPDVVINDQSLKRLRMLSRRSSALFGAEPYDREIARADQR